MWPGKQDAYRISGCVEDAGVDTGMLGSYRNTGYGTAMLDVSEKREFLREC